MFGNCRVPAEGSRSAQPRVQSCRVHVLDRDAALGGNTDAVVELG
jgi:hypothetical protein